VALGDVVDELHDEHCLADAGAAKQADLAAALVRRQQVDDLFRSTQKESHRLVYKDYMLDAERLAIHGTKGSACMQSVMPVALHR